MSASADSGGSNGPVRTRMFLGATRPILGLFDPSGHSNDVVPAESRSSALLTPQLRNWDVGYLKTGILGSPIAEDC